MPHLKRWAMFVLNSLNVLPCIQAQSKDAHIRANVTAYLTYWPLAQVYLNRQMAKAGVMSAIDPKPDGWEIIWSTPSVFSTPATRWRYVLSTFPGKLHWGHSSPPVKCRGLTAKFAVCHHTKVTSNNPFLIGCDKIERNWKPMRTGFKEDGSNRMLPGLVRSGRFVTLSETLQKKNKWKGNGREKWRLKFLSQHTRHRWPLNENWEGYGMRGLSVKTKRLLNL